MFSWYDHIDEHDHENLAILARGPFLAKSPGNLAGPISILVNFFFFADYTMITDMVLGQCFHRIIRL